MDLTGSKNKQNRSKSYRPIAHKVWGLCNQNPQLKKKRLSWRQSNQDSTPFFSSLLLLLLHRMIKPNYEQVSSSVTYTVDPVNLSGRTLLKGRVSTQEVFHLSNSDLVPGKYEGGLKLWEGSLDLVKTLQSEIQDGQLLFTGKRVLELGCGHGLPGIFTGLEGAAVIHFQDFNAEVLRCLTIPNVNANLLKKSQPLATDVRSGIQMQNFVSLLVTGVKSIKFFLMYIPEKDHNCSPGLGQSVGYDVILMAETVYSISALPHLYELIKKVTCSLVSDSFHIIKFLLHGSKILYLQCLNRLNGVVYMAAKKHYFGVGGGSAISLCGG
ncbi:hypothetical protein LOK49_LG07G01146 [Camellia lanceoleosa]|uniref:Uncharacterized protein n=1 Tax=Camellia lanceoleosa TaxID=1840588 RepID=A0ACC0H396_9ERIC|nr:hypothetical protein LOK49_LG07G01146 [Camellia lanceoleosa]